MTDLARFILDLPAPRGARVTATVFAPPGGAREAHLIVEARPELRFPDAVAALSEAYARAQRQLGLAPDTAVFRRVFASDLANQAAVLADDPTFGSLGDDAVAVSLIEQPPLPGRRLALWAYHVADPAGPLRKRREGDFVRVERPGRAHLWAAGLVAKDRRAGVEGQTVNVLARLARGLAAEGATLAADALRTWLYLRDIDRDYPGLVSARRAVFAEHGLTAETHYITSTGIGGRTAEPTDRVVLDAWSVAGLDAEQLRFLEAPRHLGPTSAYGVTFERGTRVAYGDRAHVLLSGTASIDPQGAVVGIGDIDAQLGRMAENFDALLADAEARPSDLAMLLFYLRDPADEARTRALAATRYPDVPHLVLYAPVCRPTWLVEMEGVALTSASTPRWPAY